MRPCLAAILVLHLFAFAGLFAPVLGLAPTLPELTAVQPLAEALPAVEAGATEHAPGDLGPELPEALQRVPVRVLAETPVQAPAAPATRRPAPPVLDGPQRPPRA